MLNDLKQPAKDWLADAMENLSGLLGDGDDPSFTLDVFGAEIEIRLNKLPGHFERPYVPKPLTCTTCINHPLQCSECGWDGVGMPTHYEAPNAALSGAEPASSAERPLEGTVMQED